MDHGERIAKVETEVKSIENQFHEIKEEQVRLREGQDKLCNHLARSIADLRDHTDQSIADLRDHTDRSIADLRDHTDRSIADLRDHTDRSIADLRDHTDQGFAEIRSALNEIQKENARTARWLVGLTITYGTAIIGMMAKMAGMF